MSETTNYFKQLSEVKGKTETKGNMNLTYMSWAEAWSQLKNICPQAVFHVFENDQGMPYFKDEKLVFVKVGVSIEKLTHIVHLPVLDLRNKSVKPEDVDSFQVNKSIQRALTKAIAMHGLGLYVYQGEDYPDKATDAIVTPETDDLQNKMALALTKKKEANAALGVGVVEERVQ